MPGSPAGWDRTSDFRLIRPALLPLSFGRECRASICRICRSSLLPGYGVSSPEVTATPDLLLMEGLLRDRLPFSVPPIAVSPYPALAMATGLEPATTGSTVWCRGVPQPLVFQSL